MPEAVIGSPERVAAHVVTSENLAAFTAKRLDLAPPAAAAPAAAPAAETPKEGAPKAEAAPAAEKKEAAPPATPAEEAAKLEAELKAEEAKPKAQQDEKKKQTVRERISEINEKKKSAEAEAAKERERAEKAERELAEERARRAAPPGPPAAEPELKAPQRSDFGTEEEYQDARVEFGVRKALAAERKTQAEAAAKAEGERVVQTYTERLRAAKAEHPDYDQRIEKVKDMPIPPYVRDAIFESEVGPLLPLYFADHPEEARRVTALSPVSALRELGKIEAMIETTRAQAAKPAPKADAKPAAEISGAPPPITPIKSGAGGAVDTQVDSEGRFTGTYAQFKALRKAGKI